MKKIISLLCIFAIIISFMPNIRTEAAFPTKILVVDSADLRRGNDVQYANSLFFMARNQGAIGTSSYMHGILKLDISNMDEVKYINKVELKLFIRSITGTVYLGIYDLPDYTWPENHSLGGCISWEDGGPKTFGDRICPSETCTHKAVDDLENPSPYCESIVKVTADMNLEWVTFDITNYVKKLRSEGKTEATIGIKSDYYITTSDVKTNYGWSSGNCYLGISSPMDSSLWIQAIEDYYDARPYLSVDYRARHTDATIKNVSFTGGIFDKTFKPEITDYEIGFVDETISFPQINYTINDEYAVLESQTDATNFNETTEVKIKAEDGSIKTYTFLFKKMSDMGFTADGKVTLEEIILKNSDTDETVTNELPYGSKINISANIRNNNILQKDALLLAVVKKDGVTDKIYIDSKKAQTGNTLYTLSDIAIPRESDKPSLEIFVLDTLNDKNLLGVPVVVPQNNIALSKSEKEVNITSDDLTTDILKISGKLSVKDEDVFVTIYEDTKKNYTYSLNTPEEILASTKLIATFKTDSEGYYTTCIKMGETSGDYTLKLNAEGYSKPFDFYYATPTKRKEILASMYQSGDYSSVTDKTKTDYQALGIDLSVIEQVNKTNLDTVIKSLADASEKNSDDLNAFLDIFNTALIIEKINSGLISDISSYNNYFAFNSVALNYYSEFSEEVKKNLSQNKMSGASLMSENAVCDKFTEQVILEVVNNPGNPLKVISLIYDFHNEIGLSGDEFNAYINLGETLQGQHAVKLLEKCGNTSLTSLKSNIVTQTAAVLYVPPVIVGGGGSGGGGGGGSVITDVDITGDITPAQPNLDTITNALPFMDMSSAQWAETAVYELYNKGIINGTSESTFEPQREVKREEFIKMLDTLYEGSYETVEFSDVDSSSWYAPFVAKAVNAGIIKGIDNNTFGTDRGVTREDMAVILVRILNTETLTSSDSFNDDSDISAYAKDAVYTLKNMGIVSGTGEGNFEPKRVMTRAEAAVVISNFIKKINLN